jgi:DNA (cytosine-5)-methyltransferase 1
LPPLRSGLSRGLDDATAWRREVTDAARLLASIYKGKDNGALRESFQSVSSRMRVASPAVRAASCLPEGYGNANDQLLQWIERPELRALGSGPIDLLEAARLA